MMQLQHSMVEGFGLKNGSCNDRKILQTGVQFRCDWLYVSALFYGLGNGGPLPVVQFLKSCKDDGYFFRIGSVMPIFNPLVETGRAPTPIPFSGS